jgi:hypothetical protein
MITNEQLPYLTGLRFSPRRLDPAAMASNLRWQMQRQSVDPDTMPEIQFFERSREDVEMIAQCRKRSGCSKLKVGRVKGRINVILRYSPSRPVGTIFTEIHCNVIRRLPSCCKVNAI